jgi:dephospho-CoA kinase
MIFRLGLTGSIGMGKSTTARMFADAGCLIWDADAAVHRLYATGGSAVDAMQAAFPDAIIDHAVSRERLRSMISRDPETLPRIEAIVHPLVQKDRRLFMDMHPDAIGVFDVPLLYETGAEEDMDAVACVTVAPEVQKNRVLARGTMTDSQFDQILAKQLPMTEKMRRSDYVIETDTLEHARYQVQDVVTDIKRRISHA